MAKESWRSDILAGIEVLPQPGCPGVILLTSNAPHIIASGKSGIIIAASEFGEGRVVAISHNGYFDGFPNKAQNRNLTTLQNNIIWWASKNEYSDPRHVQIMTNGCKRIHPRTKVLVMISLRWSEISDDNVLMFIAKGGGLVHAVCPWGWCQINNDKSYDDIPFHSVLKSTGIEYSDRFNDYSDGCYVGFGCIPPKTLVTASLDVEGKISEHYVKRLDDWRKEILFGIESVPVIGVPGTVVCYGELSGAVLKGRFAKDVVIAAAEIGQGRVVAVPHNGYFVSDDNTGTAQDLLRNIIRWVSRARCSSKGEAVILDNSLPPSSLSMGVSVLINLAVDNDCIKSKDIIEYIRKGG